jgi:hypothetical protein
MKKYIVKEVFGSFGIFLDDVIEAENSVDAMEQVMSEIIDNIGNYIDIELEEIDEEDDDEECTEEDD